QHFDLRQRRLRVPADPLARGLLLAVARDAGARRHREEIDEAVRADADERLEPYGVAVVAVPLPALRRRDVVVGHDGVAVQVERAALRVGLDVDDLADARGHDQPRALVAGERGRVERGVARARPDA